MLNKVVSIASIPTEVEKLLLIFNLLNILVRLEYGTRIKFNDVTQLLFSPDTNLADTRSAFFVGLVRKQNIDLNWGYISSILLDEPLDENPIVDKRIKLNGIDCIRIKVNIIKNLTVLVSRGLIEVNSDLLMSLAERNISILNQDLLASKEREWLLILNTTILDCQLAHEIMA